MTDADSRTNAILEKLRCILKEKNQFAFLVERLPYYSLIFFGGGKKLLFLTYFVCAEIGFFFLSLKKRKKLFRYLVICFRRGCVMKKKSVAIFCGFGGKEGG